MFSGVKKLLKLNIEQTNSIISHIEFDNSSYTKSFVYIYLKPGVSSGDFENLKAQLSIISDEIDPMGEVLIAITATKARATIDMLYQLHYINASDKSGIENTIREVEKNTGYAVKTSYAASAAQVDVIEHIVSLSNDHRKIVTLLTYAFSRNLQYEMDDLVKLIKSTGKNDDEVGDVLESFFMIVKVCRGTTGLESTYERLGQSLPDAQKQREKVVDGCLKMINKTYNGLSIADRFDYATELMMMTCTTQRNIHPGYTKSFLDSILNGTAESRDIFSAFTFLGGFSDVVFKSVLKAKLTSAEIKTLSDETGSQVLKDLIRINFKVGDKFIGAEPNSPTIMRM